MKTPQRELSQRLSLTSQPLRRKLPMRLLASMPPGPMRKAMLRTCSR